MEKFIEGYVECLLWIGTNERGEPLDDLFDVDDIAPEAMREIETDCGAFMHDNAADLERYADERDCPMGQAMDHAGHDFALTRNGHGTGFWDRGMGALGDRLSDASKAWGSQDLYVGDDGLLYVHG